jgi:hypothetical protein
MRRPLRPTRLAPLAAVDALVLAVTGREAI